MHWGQRVLTIAIPLVVWDDFNRFRLLSSLKFGPANTPGTFYPRQRPFSSTIPQLHLCGYCANAYIIRTVWRGPKCVKKQTSMWYLCFVPPALSCFGHLGILGATRFNSCCFEHKCGLEHCIASTDHVDAQIPISILWTFFAVLGGHYSVFIYTFDIVRGQQMNR